MTSNELCDLIVDAVAQHLKPLFDSDVITVTEDGTEILWSDILDEEDDEPLKLSPEIQDNEQPATEV